MYATQLDDPTPMSAVEYLAFADEQELKYEFRGGHIYAMTGGSVRHGVITANTSTHLNIQLRESDCTVTSPDVRIQIASKQAYRYPDVTVFCGDAVYAEDRSDTITNPTLLVEVLSPSSVLRDSNEKLEEYITIASLSAYLLIAQDKPKVELYHRHEGDKWLYQIATGFDATVTVAVADTTITITLAELYRRVDFDAPQDPDDGE